MYEDVMLVYISWREMCDQSRILLSLLYKIITAMQ